MIGRAAKGNPWIFQRRSRQDVALNEVSSILHQHLEGMLDFYGQDLGLLRFRKHLAAYIQPMEIPHDTRFALLTSSTKSQLSALLKEIGL